MERISPDGKTFVVNCLKSKYPTEIVISINFQNQSTITSEDCIQIQNNLNALHNFLKMNTQLCSSYTAPNQQSTTLNSTGLSQSLASPTVQDAQVEERQSLDALKMFVCHCCQIVGLWRILCDHQFHDLVGKRFVIEVELCCLKLTQP